jgi:hypothetical protein
VEGDADAVVPGGRDVVPGAAPPVADRCEEALDAARAPAEISGKGSAVAETALGDVAADAMRAAVKADVALYYDPER